MQHEERPQLTLGISENEFVRWYWTMAELQPFARKLGVSAAGPKALLTSRIAASLGGRPLPPPPSRPAARSQLNGPLSKSTEIPEGQKANQLLRTFFEVEIGPQFKFNGHMRQFLLLGGSTLGDAIEHWHQTAGQPLKGQSESLEFNRFTKAWHRDNPDGSATECREAWAAHRALPVDQRNSPTSDS